jgi:hypothetical protein
VDYRGNGDRFASRTSLIPNPQQYSPCAPHVRTEIREAIKESKFPGNIDGNLEKSIRILEKERQKNKINWSKFVISFGIQN